MVAHVSGFPVKILAVPDTNGAVLLWENVARNRIQVEAAYGNDNLTARKRVHRKADVFPWADNEIVQQVQLDRIGIDQGPA